MLLAGIASCEDDIVPTRCKGSVKTLCAIKCATCDPGPTTVLLYYCVFLPQTLKTLSRLIIVNNALIQGVIRV